MRTALRHRLQDQGASASFELDGLSVDLVRRDDTVVKLSPDEYDLVHS